MHIKFPILERNPSTFDSEPKNKSLVASEKLNTIYDINREIYVGDPYIYNVSYKNINNNDYVLLRDFYNTVETIIPFLYMLESTVHTVAFQTPIKVSKNLYGLYDVSFSLETIFSSIGNWASLDTSIIDALYSIPGREYEDGTLNNNMACNLIHIDSDDAIVTNMLSIPTLYVYYTIKTRLDLFYGIAPYIATSIQNTYPFFTTTVSQKRIKPGYEATYFVATQFDLYIGIWNPASDIPSKWSLNITLQRYI